MKQQGAKSQGDAKSRDARKFSKAGKGGKVMLDGMSHHERLDGDEMFNGALDRGDPNYDLDGEMDALSAGVSSMAVADSTADSAAESIFQPGGSEPADLTAWTNPNGGTAAMAGEFKMDFEGKRETVTKERVAELVGQAQENGKVDYKKISLANKSYTADAAVSLGETLKSFTSVEVADLADIIAGRMEAEALEVLSTISNSLGHLDLQAIDLSDNALGEKGVRACDAILLKKKCLQQLWFNNNGISAECAEVIAKTVLSNNPTSLRLFHFHNNMSGPKGAEHLATIVVNSPKLQDLRFSGTRCLSEGSLAFAQGIADLAAKQFAAEGKGLFVRLDIADNCFGEDGGALLAKVLSNQPHLEFLNLRDGGLGDEGATAVCSALKDNAATAPKLKVLELSGNDLTGAVMDVVMECATSKPLLEVLGLEENDEIGSEGGTAIAAGLAGAPADFKKGLTSLSINTCEIGGQAGIALAKALEGYSGMTSLGMNGNFFSTEALETVESTLEKLGLTKALPEDPFDENDDESDE